MKSKEKIEEELLKATHRRNRLKKHMSSATLLMNYERIKVLEWVISDSDDNLSEVD